MKILFFVRSFKNMAGGIENKSLELAQGFKSRGHVVEIISLDSEGDEAFYTWPLDVFWHKVGVGDPRNKANTKARITRIIRIRKILKNEFDIAIGFQVGAFFLLRLSGLGLKIRTIAAERNAPTLFSFIKYGRVKKFFSNLILLQASSITILFPDFINFYPKYLRQRIVVTPNWVPVLDQYDSSIIKNNSQILFVGRFSYQKNVEVLISAVSIMKKPTELILIGSGEGLDNARKLADKLKIDCKFLPPTLNLRPFYGSSRLLCLPSRWEGFPNVVAEALAFGLPVVAFQNCAGVPELVINNKMGVLAKGMDDPKALAKALDCALDLEFNSLDISLQMRQYSFDRFINTWEQVCTSIINKKSHD